MPQIRSNPTAKAREARLVKNLQKYLKTHADLKSLSPYALDGVRLFNYLFDATRAAEKVPCPKGFVLLPIAVESQTKRAEKVGAVASEISRIVSVALQGKKAAIGAAIGRLKAERQLKKPAKS